MPIILPSQIVEAIDDLFGPTRNEIYSQAITAQKRAEVHALLLLLDQLPPQVIDLPFREYLEFTRCRAVLATALPRWAVGDVNPVRDVYGKDPVERIRRLMKECRDEQPPPEPELPFIADLDTRVGIQDRIHAAWTDFNAREWMGATVFAGGALEALLLWALKQSDSSDSESAGRLDNGRRKISLEKMHLTELIDEATKMQLISADAANQARLAKDARNLLHPGKVARSGVAFSKASALTGLAGVYRAIDDLKQGAVGIPAQCRPIE